MNLNRIAIFFIICLVAINSFSQDYYSQAYKILQLFNYIDNYYVDTVNKEKIVEDAINNVLKNLDPHSTYLTKEEVKEMNEPLQGNFEGIGIFFNILKDTIYVISPVVGGPSERVGVEAGDRIIKVNGENVAGIGITNKDVFRYLKGKKGTEVTISVKRHGVKKLLDFTIIRDKIPLYSIDASYKVKDDIGYIKLSRFSMTSINEFISAIQELKEQHVKKLILDLSGNGGGYLDIAFQLADEFLNGNKLIVYTEGLHNPKVEYKAMKKGEFENGPLVVIINEGSASASEIVSGAIQDWDRGIIVGRRSFGKGLVQRPILFRDTSMVRLTVAKYYTPTGRLIQKPYDSDHTKYDRDILSRHTNGELYSDHNIEFPDSLKYFTIVKKRTVYGGGGIMPDFVIPIDTSYFSDFYRDLFRSGILNRFTLQHIDKNRSILEEKYSTFDEFNSNFSVSDKLFNELVEFSKKEDIDPSKEDIQISKPKIKLILKAYIARDIWNTNEFYQIMNQDEPKFQKAIEILENWDKYKP